MSFYDCMRGFKNIIVLPANLPSFMSLVIKEDVEVLMVKTPARSYLISSDMTLQPRAIDRYDQIVLNSMWYYHRKRVWEKMFDTHYIYLMKQMVGLTDVYLPDDNTTTNVYGRSPVSKKTSSSSRTTTKKKRRKRKTK